MRPEEVECPKCGVVAGEYCLMKTPYGFHSVRKSKALHDSSCTSEWTRTTGGYEGGEYTTYCDLPLGHAGQHSSTETWTDEEAAA